MNKHLLSTIAAAMVPIGMSSASVQPPSAYSYLGSRNNKNTTYATSSNTPNVANKYAQQRINENPLALNVNENTDKLTAASLHQLYERGASKKRIRQYRARWLGWVISMMAVAVTARAEDCPQVSFELIDSTSTLVCDPIAFATSYVSGDVLLDEITSSNRILTSSSSSNSLIAGRTYSYTDSTGYDFHGTWSDSGWTSADSGLIPIGSLSTSTSYIDFISLPSTTTSDTAVDMFDFNITDGDGNGDPADGLSLDVTQLMVNVTGTSTDALRGSVTWRLNGDDVGNVEGLYDENSDTITFSGLNISVADGASETYSVNAYMNDANAVTDNATFIFTIDGDTDLTVSSTGTQMGSTDPVSNGVGGMFEVVATKLKYTTVPAGSVSGSSLTTQPVVTAVDAFGNTDVDFSETITLTEASAGSLTGGSVAAVNGVATFAAVNYTATADQQSFVLTANDQDGVDTDLGTVDASAITSTLPLNAAPVISGSPSTTVNDGSTYSFTPTVTDADSGDTKTFNITGTPSWAVFNEATGTLSGSPSNSHIGELSNITITVTDSASAQGSLSFSLEVTERNYAPSISGSPATQVTEGSAYSFRPSVSDANNSDSHTFSISGKPSWASFSTSNGRLSGTPTISDVGLSSNIVITVTDSASASARLNSFSIEVVNKNTAPVVSAQSVSVLEDEALTIVLSGTDAEDDSVSLSIVSLPTHGSLTANTAENSWTYRAGCKLCR